MDSPNLIIKQLTVTRPQAGIKSFGVYSKFQGIMLGRIEYNVSYKAYSFYPNQGTVWSPADLGYVSSFLVSLLEPAAKPVDPVKSTESATGSATPTV